jgi:Aminopeptidase C
VVFENPIGDGGQWNMFVNLVQKYGVVPKNIMPDTFNRNNTMFMGMILRRKLRRDASILRGLYEEGKTADELRLKKREMMNEIYKILSINLGEPPKTFRWQYRDKDKKFFRIGEMTPKEFFNRYVDLDFDDYVSLIDCPQKTKRYDHMYTVEFLNNMEGGRIVRYLNAEIGLLKGCAVKSIVDGEPVWFCSDVGKMMEAENGIMNPDLFDYELVYGTEFDMDKAAELDYGESFMTHAMVLTGVDLEEDKPIKWNVENSWGSEREGKKIGKDGYFMMSDGWFSSYVYEVVVHKKYLPEDILKVLEEEPTVLEPWDPMGTVARSFGDDSS